MRGAAGTQCGLTRLSDRSGWARRRPRAPSLSSAAAAPGARAAAPCRRSWWVLGGCRLGLLPQLATGMGAVTHQPITARLTRTRPRPPPAVTAGSFPPLRCVPFASFFSIFYTRRRAFACGASPDQRDRLLPNRSRSASSWRLFAWGCWRAAGMHRTSGSSKTCRRFFSFFGD